MVFAENTLESLAGSASRKIVSDHDFMHLLVAGGDSRVDPLLQLLRLDTGRREDDRRYRHLAPFIVWHSVYGHFSHCWMLHDYLLYVFRENIHPARYDHVFFSVYEMKKS